MILVNDNIALIITSNHSSMELRSGALLLRPGVMAGLSLSITSSDTAGAVVGGGGGDVGADVPANTMRAICMALTITRLGKTLNCEDGIVLLNMY